MQSTSRSNRWKGKNSKFVPKPKQVWRVKQPTRNWLDLPTDLTMNILQRISVVDVLDNAQKVCTPWRDICKDPAMWRVIHMDRSQGELVDLSMAGFWDCDILQYVADRSSQLRRLEIIPSQYHPKWRGILIEALKKFSLLEELILVTTDISQEGIETVGRYSPLLNTLKVKDDRCCAWTYLDDGIAIAIGKNLPELTHLELHGIPFTNMGLQALLDGCCHLESLDLRHCLVVDIKDLRKRCSQQIKYLNLSAKRLEQYSHTSDVLDDSDYNAYVDVFDGDYFVYSER